MVAAPVVIAIIILTSTWEVAGCLSVCKSVGDSVIFGPEGEKHLSLYIYIRPEAPKLLRPTLH